MSISRTYQGRVNGAHFVSGKSFSRTESLSKESYQTILRDHLAIYQDAVNYYIICFAACARGSKLESLANLELRVKEAWHSHEYRKAGSNTGFCTSLTQRFKNDFSSGTSFENACEKITGKHADQELLNLSIEALLTDLGGESSIQQGGRSYLPYFCSPKTKANFPRSTQLLERDQAKASLPQALSQTQDPEEIRKNYQIHHFATLMKGQQPFTSNELKENLTEWLKHLVSEKLASPAQQSSWQKEIKGLSDEATLPRYNGASAKGSEKNRLYAFLLLKLLPPSKERLELLKSTFPEPAAEKTKSKLPSKKDKEQAARETRLTSRSNDPIELARGERKYVFRSFSNYFAGIDPSEGPAWTEFDIAAFKEALKTLNQIEQKTSERLDELASIESKITFYQNATGTPLDPDEPVTFHKDDRFTLIEKLKERLSGTLDDDFKANGYRLRWATIKGWPSIKERFRKTLLREPEIGTESLIKKTITAFQTTTKNIGSVTLFRILAEPEFHPIWQEVPEERITDWAKHQWSQDLLTDVVKHDLLLADREDLKKNLHIKLTPAHLQYSRRLIMLSDFGGNSKVVHLTRLEENRPEGEAKTIPSLIASVYHLNPETSRHEEQRIELTYTAPRLVRDGISGGENRSLLQPLLQGLGFSLPELEKISLKPKPLAVALMPDWQASSIRQRSSLPDRYILNFPATLETDWIAEKINALNGKKGQFNGPTDEPLHLHWAETAKEKAKKDAWWLDSQIQKHGFTLAAFDLGIRTAAAYSVYHVVSSLEQVPLNKKRLARLAGEAGGFSWYAYPFQRGTLRLPGEDQLELRPTSKQDRTVKRLRENYGKRGRRADVDETKQFTSVTEEITQYLAPWLTEKIETYRTSDDTHYLTDQNDLLVTAARQVQSYLRSSHRLLIDLRKEGCLSFEQTENLHSRHADLLAEHAKDPTPVLVAHILEIKKILGRLLEFSANRILPLRHATWEIEEKDPIEITGIDEKPISFSPFELVERKLALETKPPKIRGQGGLSLKRIERIEDLRKRLLSYQREMNREPGKEMKIGFGRHSGSIPDAAPQLLRKLDELKDQRVKQTAHLILTRSLNLRLKDRKTPLENRKKEQAYIHGEYEPIGQLPSRRHTVDFIVIEDLNRYRAEQGKSRAENRQLMQWSHRSITNTLRDIVQPYGLSVLGTAAGFSSKFCSITGRPGFRADEITPGAKGGFALSTWLKSKDNRRKNIATQIESLLEKYSNKRGLSFLIPSNGGKMFVPGISHQESRTNFPIQQADLNASQNLALRAIASPSSLDMIHKVRAACKADKLTLRCENIREKSFLDPKTEIAPKLRNSPVSKEVRGKKYSNFFFLGFGSKAILDVKFDATTCTLPSGKTLQLASNYGLWSTFKDTIELENMVIINNDRLSKLNLPERLIIPPHSKPQTEESNNQEDPEDEISL